MAGVHLQPSNLSALGSDFPHPGESHTTSFGERGFSFPFPCLRLPGACFFVVVSCPFFLSAATELWLGSVFVGGEVRGERERARGTVCQTPGTLDTLRYNSDTLLFAQPTGVQCLQNDSSKAETLGR